MRRRPRPSLPPLRSPWRGGSSVRRAACARRAARVALAAVLVALASPRAGAVTAPEGAPADALDLPLPGRRHALPARSVALPADPRLRSAFPVEGWRAWTDPRTGAIRQAWGPGIRVASAVADETHAERLARDFLTSRVGILETRPEEMVLRGVRRAAGKYAVWFRQEIGGLALQDAEAFVLLTGDGVVAAFGSTFAPDPGAIAPPALSERDAVTAAASALGARLRPGAATPAELALVRAPVGEALEPVPAWRTVIETDRPFGRWETWVDARSGAVLGRRNLIRFIDVVGSVENVPEPSGRCSPGTLFPSRRSFVEVLGGSSAHTTESGSFVVPHGGALPVLVSAELRGEFANVNRAPGLGNDAAIVEPATPGVPVVLRFDASNSLAEERDAYHHTLLAHDFLKALDSTITMLDYSMPVTVSRTDGVCPGNAWWDGVGMSFCAGSATFGNTARMQTVVYHEYGHAVADAIYARNGTVLTDNALSEGNSDVVSNLMTGVSQVGIGWFATDCNSFLRDSSNGLVYPDDLVGGSGHSDGRMIAGFHWDLWQSLLLAMPRAVADSIALRLWFDARDLGTPQTMPDQVLWTFLADDDDGDLGDGSPNFDHLCLGATNHGFECPDPSSQVVIVHDPLGHVTDGTQPFDVVATVTSTTGVIVPSTVTLSWSVNGRPFVSVPMAPTGNPDEYAGQISPQSPMARVEYYVSASDDQDHSATSPRAAPSTLHGFEIAWLYDPVESAAGWTAGVPGDDATSGAWIHVDPVGTLAQPEDDVSALPDQVKCFVTGQCAAGWGTCWAGCSLGCNDVDGGTTTLLSPVYDVTGAGAALLRFERWFSNDLAANPGEDLWVVDVSNDGGASWTNVESTTVSETAWRTIEIDLVALFGAPAQVRLRFTVSDLVNPSLVEAAVDDVRILAAFGPAVEAADLPVASSGLELAQNRPNPGGPGTEIGYALPEPSRVRLTIYDVRGRAVRDLVSGERPAGPGVVRWDGRDGAGERVAPGVYFYRLTTPAGSLTRKMTVAP